MSTSRFVSGNNGKKTRNAATVEVITCPPAFPDFRDIGGGNASGGPRKRPRRDYEAADDSRRGRGLGAMGKVRELDFDETAREIHKLGSTGFTGKKAKRHKQAEYKSLTGRDMKKEKVPVKIARGIRKARDRRERREEKEAKESGVVSGAAFSGGGGTGSGKSGKIRRGNGYSEEKRRASRIHGPAPDVGHLKGGILRVRKEGGNR